MLVLLVNAATGGVSHFHPTSPQTDALRADTDTVIVPSRGRLLYPFRDYKKSRNSYINPLDSIMKARQNAVDSLRRVQDSIRQISNTDMVDKDLVVPENSDSVVKLDSTETKEQITSLSSDSLPELPSAESLRGFRAEDDTLKNDTTKKNDSMLDFPVQYEAADSTVYLPGEGFAHFFGSSKVNYQQIELASQVITMSIDSSIVRAHGVADSLGVLQGKPVFKEGETEYTSETMSYNFKTKKGFITNVDTQQGDGFLTSERSKKGDNDELFLEHGRYTTCDEEHPHFYLALSRAKVRPKKDVVFGPAWLVIEDVPLPFAIPFGFFPFSSSYSSGFIMPSYGDDSRRGFYLRDGGYYFAISDFMDLRATGEIYTKGSWGANLSSNYARRYKYRGSFQFDYQTYVTGEKNMPDYSKQKSIRLNWSHTQDAKANPNSTFSASVNYSTSSYDRNSMSSLYDPSQMAQSTKTSSISYSRTFSDIGLTLSTSTNLSMSTRDSTISMTLPDLNITLARMYPFKRKNAAGKERWYEKIALSYSGQLSNSITAREDEILHKNLFKDWRNGFKHSIPVSAAFTIFKYINVTPSVNYTERWYSFKENRSWDDQRMVERRDTIYGFNRVYNWDLSLSASTKLYGFYRPWKMFGDKIQMIRHVLTPNLSYSYAPDFSASRYGFYDTYLKTDAKGNVSTVQYSPYQSGLYGVPGKGKTGSISLSLGNNVEMKVRSDKDSTGVKKVSLIDELSASMSYNTAALDHKWSDLNMNARIKITKNYTFNMSAVFATYAYSLDDNGNPYLSNETEYSRGRFGRFQGTSQHLSYTLNNETFKKLFGKKDDSEKKNKKGGEDVDADEDSDVSNTQDTTENKEKKESAATDTDGYMKFKLPWQLSISYSVTMAEDRTKEKFNTKTMRYPYKLTHQLNFSGNLKLSDAWNINYSSGYDFTMHRLSTTTVNISRDLHCFALSGGMVLSSYGATSYNFTIRATAGTLADALKWDKRSGVNNAVQWY